MADVIRAAVWRALSTNLQVTCPLYSRLTTAVHSFRLLAYMFLNMWLGSRAWWYPRIMHYRCFQGKLDYRYNSYWMLICQYQWVHDFICHLSCQCNRLLEAIEETATADNITWRVQIKSQTIDVVHRSTDCPNVLRGALSVRLPYNVHAIY